MGLLDGGIQSVFGAAFGGLYLAGTMTRRTLTDDGTGSIGAATATHSVRAQVDQATQAMRAQDGYADGDVRILILASGVTAPNTDDRITVGGTAYSIMSVGVDPASSYYDCRARPA